MAGLSLFFGFRHLRKKRLLQALNLRLLSVCLPQQSDGGDQKKDFKDEINISAQLFSILSGLNMPFTLEAAVHHIGEEINFYVGVPKSSIPSVSRQIEGLFKDAQVEPAEDYNIFSSAGTSSAIYLKQKHFYALPIRTYVETNVDTFAPILSGLSKINEVAEGGAIQIIAKPAPNSSKKNISQMVAKLKQGAKLDELLKGMKMNFRDLENVINPQTQKDKEREEKEKVIDQEAIKILEEKVSKPLLAVNFRTVTFARDQLQADTILGGIVHAASQFSAPFRQELQIMKPRNPKKLLYQYSFREFDENQSMVLNTEELASLFHFPIPSTDIPRIAWLKSREASPPENLPKTGTFIGESIFRGDRKNIYITEEDRRRHVYVIGQTGTGKTTFMINMLIDDIRKGKGVSIIDPHGEFVDTILSLMPKERIDDVIVFDPGNLKYPMGMNMLEYDFEKPEEKTFIVNELFNIFDKLYDMKNAGGPMFEQYFKMATMLLMEDMVNEPATLMEIQRVFTDDNYRERKLARIANPTVVDFWEKEASKATGEHSLANMATYITSKINQFTANDFLRPIIGQEKSAFNFRQVMDEGKILLINLSKGRIGDINAGLLGMVIVGKILMAALSRADVSQDKRRDFNLYIDEFQNFTTESTSVILSEARKYRLNLTMAHQFIAQLPENIRDSIFGNVGSKIIFRVGVQDAEFLVKEFEPVLSQNDLLNIANLNAYAKILINGKTTKPFNIFVPFPPRGDSALAEHLKEISQTKYGMERQEVEQNILSRFRS